MPVTYIGGSTQYGTGARVFVPPADTKVGDFVIAVAQMIGGSTTKPAGPAGFAKIIDRDGLASVGSTGENHTVWATTLTAVPSSWTVTVAANSGVSIVVYRGAKAVETIGSAGPALPASPLETYIPSVTPAATGGHLVAIGDWRSTLTAPPGLSPGYTLREMFNSGTWSYAIADRPVTTSGPT